VTDVREALGAQRLAGELRRCVHARKFRFRLENGDSQCARCQRVIPAALSKRGRNARIRGNSRELELAKDVGGQKVGMFGGETDVRSGLINAQSKVRKAFPYWTTRELDRLPRTGGRIPALIVTDAPGPGIRRRSIVVLTLEDFTDLHGRITAQEAP
jgi:translation initiation factor IF-1